MSDVVSSIRSEVEGIRCVDVRGNPAVTALTLASTSAAPG
jgi:hypothetical protein